MSDFKAKMHLNRLWKGLRPRPRWRSLQRSPDPLAAFKGPSSKDRERWEWRRGVRIEEKGKRGGEEKREGGNGNQCVSLNFL